MPSKPVKLRLAAAKSLAPRMEVWGKIATSKRAILNSREFQQIVKIDASYDVEFMDENETEVFDYEPSSPYTAFVNHTGELLSKLQKDIHSRWNLAFGHLPQRPRLHFPANTANGVKQAFVDSTLTRIDRYFRQLTTGKTTQRFGQRPTFAIIILRSGAIQADDGVHRALTVKLPSLPSALFRFLNKQVGQKYTRPPPRPRAMIVTYSDLATIQQQSSRKRLVTRQPKTSTLRKIVSDFNKCFRIAKYLHGEVLAPTGKRGQWKLQAGIYFH